MKESKCGLVLSLLVLAALGPAQAADVVAAGTPLADLLKCAQIAEGKDRLACYDATVAPLQERVAKANKEAEKSTSLLDWFGLGQRPQTPQEFGLELHQASAITAIDAGVTEWATRANGRLIFFLDNGQIWRQIDGDRTKFHDLDDKPPVKVHIEEGALGSFNLKIIDRTGMLKVTRVK